MNVLFKWIILIAFPLKFSFAGGVTRQFTEPGLVPNGPIHKIFPLTNGQMLVQGKFTAWGKVTSSTARLNTDGTIDTSFNSGAGFNHEVYGWAQQSDGKIIATGAFTGYAGVLRNRVVRLASSGSLDSTFNVGTGLNAAGNVAVVQSDGKILIGGDFTSYNGTSVNRLVRINSDGTIDSGFTIGTGFNGSVHDLVIQSDGKIIVVGAFTTVNGVSSARIARLNADGTRDTAFTPGAGFSSNVWEIKLTSDEKIVAVGEFATFDGTSRNKIARLNTDGTLDTSFNPGTGITGSYGPYTLAIRSDGKALLAGLFNNYNGASVSTFVLVNSDGTRDATYPLTQALDFTQYFPDWRAWRMTLLAADKVFVCGNFTHAFGSNGVFYRPTLAIYNSDGSVDSSFNPSYRFHVQNSNCLRQSDGKIITVGLSEQNVAIQRKGLIRLNRDFSADPSFDAGNWVSDGEFDISQHSMNSGSNGKLCVHGAISSLHGATRNGIGLLNADGSLDTGFDPSTGFATNSVYGCEILADGKVLAVGRFSSYRGTSRMRIARINTDGTLDTTFAPATGFSAHDVYKVIVDSDGKYVAVGAFTAYNGVSRNRIVRINSDSTLDTTFDPGTGFNGATNNVIQLPSGKYLVLGAFSSFNGTTRHDVVLLNNDGTLDTSFTSADNFTSLSSFHRDSSGRIFVYGQSGSNYVVRRLSATGTLEATSPTFIRWSTTFHMDPSGYIILSPIDHFMANTFRPFFRRLKPDLRLDY